jgi:uncharacterized radical SAM superfamily Fe-S cluster-containing enzyme
VCLTRIKAEIVKEDGKIVLKKRCTQHGLFSAVHWQSPEVLDFVEHYNYFENPKTAQTEHVSDSCPVNCDSCSAHSSNTVIGVIDVTNRCDLRCPVCFADTPSASPMPDPLLEEIYKMLKFLRGRDPPPPAVLLSGGEPLIRDDISKIVRMAHNLKFMVIVATNGLKLSQNPQLAQELKAAGLNIVYLQFDGVTNTAYERLRGAMLLKEKLRAIQVCRSCGLEVIMVPTLVQGVNDEEIGDIIQFAAENADTVRGVVFQPISFTGRNSLSAERNDVVMPRFAEETEKQTKGEIRATDLFPVTVMVPPIRVMSRFMEKPWPLFSTSPNCGVVNWVLVSKGRDKTLTPINRLLDFDTFMSHLNSIANQAESGRIGRIGIYVKLIVATLRSMNWRKTQSSVGLLTAMKTIFRMHISPSYASLGAIRRRILLVGCMAFMDHFNFDAKRARNCVIHYVTPELQVIPFCVFNNLYRTKNAETTSFSAVLKLGKQLSVARHS